MQYVAFCGWCFSPSIRFYKSSVLALMSALDSFLWPNNIPLDGQAAFCSPIHQLMSHLGVSTFQLLQIVLLCTCTYMFLFESLFSISFGIYLDVELQGCMAIL